MLVKNVQGQLVVVHLRRHGDRSWRQEGIEETAGQRLEIGISPDPDSLGDRLPTQGG